MRGMVRVHRGLAAACVACCLLVLGVAGGLVAADRDARVITPSGSPIWLDPWRALLFDSPAVVVMLENRHSAPVTSALRLWMFDAALRLKGSVDYCTIEVLERNTRGHVFVPLDIADVSVRDRAVVTVAAVASGHSVWRLRESEAAQLAAARVAANGSPAHLAFEREDGLRDAWNCPCDPRSVEAMCALRCADTGLARHEASRLLNTGCAASCTCG